MAEVQIKTAKKKSGVKRLLKKNLSVDLTPMVDLGFLLITFFILTTSLTTPTITNLIMPKDDIKETAVCESCALTLLPAGNNEVYYYEGIPTANTKLAKTNFGEKRGLRDLIQSKQQKLIKAKGTREDMMVIIKPGKDASYENILNILDEMKINDVMHYVIADKDAIDKKLLPDQ